MQMQRNKELCSGFIRSKSSGTLIKIYWLGWQDKPDGVVTLDDE